MTNASAIEKRYGFFPSRNKCDAYSIIASSSVRIGNPVTIFTTAVIVAIAKAETTSILCLTNIESIPKATTRNAVGNKYGFPSPKNADPMLTKPKPAKNHDILSFSFSYTVYSFYNLSVLIGVMPSVCAISSGDSVSTLIFDMVIPSISVIALSNASKSIIVRLCASLSLAIISS